MKQVIFAFGIWAAVLGVAQAAEQAAPLPTAATSSDEIYSAATADHMSASISTPPLPKPSADASTDAQIDGWIHAEAGGPEADDQSGGPQSGQPRAIHGEMGVSVGSNGYRNVYGVTDIPFGQNDDLGLAVSNSSYNGRHGNGGGSNTSLGVSLRLGDPSGTSSNPCGMNRSVWLPSDDRAVAGCGRNGSY